MKKHRGSIINYLNATTQNAAQTESAYRVEKIDAERIIPNEKNFYSIEGVEEMANSLAVSDHMPPLEVVDNGDGTYRLISGERRLSATLCRIRRGELEKATLPCHILPAFTAKGPFPQSRLRCCISSWPIITVRRRRLTSSMRSGKWSRLHGRFTKTQKKRVRWQNRKDHP